MAIIGIDLGTTNSLVAYFKEDHPIIIPNIYGESLTPSVVSVSEDGEVYVGRIAQERLISHPELTVSVFKRSMGSKKSYRLGSKTFTSEDLSALVIRKLKEDAEEFLGEEVDEAVISVPAYFNDTQRRATKTAGELAGLKTERIVNEPTAAAVAYGLHDEHDYTKYLVFDLGGGTFDVSILEKYNNVMEVRAVAGDNFLGGEDFTYVMMSWFIEHHNLDVEDLSYKEKSLLRKSAEDAKKALSNSRNVTVSCTINKQNYELLVTPDGYEKRCESLLGRLRNPIKRALSDASIKLQDIESVLLVGGATKMPLIRTFVSKLMGRFPSVAIDPDEVVAMGTAVHSAMKRRNKAITEIVLTDVCPYTLGTNISLRKPNGFHESGHFYPIIERNSVIPVSRSERLVTVYDNQDIINVEILQGESRKADDNVLLGELNVPIPEGKAGQEAIDVRYTYDINGILEVDITVISTGVSKTLILEKNPGILTEEEIAEKLAALKSLKVHPRDKDENRLLLAKAERLYEENIGEARMILSQEIVIFESLLDRQDEREIRDYAVRFSELLREIEDYME
ncbi:MAG: molecular chaperone HscC [Defluviitaleaceae bacterium]|nr:molecular chaperone HscC [Defluviitaleaceae bacterium]